MPSTDLKFLDPTTYMETDAWENFSLPSVKSALVLTVLGSVISCGLCTFHYLTRRERAAHKGALEGFDPVSNIEKGQAAAVDGDDDSSDVVGGGRVVAKPRYPAVDYLRGLCLMFIVTFHLLWALTDFGFLPRFPTKVSFNFPVSNYVYFAAFYSVSFTWANLLFIFIHPYLYYLIFSIATLLCIYILCWESEISGVCLIMLCVGISLAIVHEDRVKWRNVIIRTLKLGVAAGALSAITYTFMPRSPIYFGAIHCITLNTLLTMFFIRVPRVALLGFICIQLYTIMVGRFPLEVPTNRPTVDVIPWFHNLGYCLLGLWLHSVGAHKIAVVEIIPGKPIHLEDTVFTFFGRHSLTVYLAHMIPVLLILAIFVYSQ
ncbi:hypothetical protein FOZ60_000012 [Perkinsus olseni]|uniref:Heparan-alpha-glucosaminide N-acetyltransferase catalytic domain-containing protein n=3 Tax=Perkinsus olseni TaxID=32597 RepID=A0A7J6PPV3_PEROL|nr:hypothetical protein FOZ60_000012 [Perkinsus olseni]